MSEFMVIAAEIGKEAAFCTESANIWQVVGYVLLIFKIVIPLLVIILGMIDLGKAVVAGKDDEVKKNIKSLMWRAIAAVIIFFIPTLVTLIMGLVTNFEGSNAKKDFEVCKQCIASPGGSKCKANADKANNGLAGVE